MANKKINNFRRIITRFFTRLIVNKSFTKKTPMVERNSINRILISRPNHRLGNQLLITPIIQEVTKIFPSCKIDLFVKGNIGPVLFKNYSNVENVIQLPKNHFNQIGLYLKNWFELRKTKYDLAINVVENSASGKLSIKFVKSKYKYFGFEYMKNHEDLNNPDFNHAAKKVIYGLRRYLFNNGLIAENTSVPLIDLKLTNSEISEGKSTIYRLFKNKNKTISLFTYGTNLKCYSKEWWKSFYECLVNNFPDYNIVEILPVENVSQIDFKAKSFYSKDIRHLASIIANTSVFIGADSGMMHLASASQTTTIGLFSVTNPIVYCPYGNNSIAIDTNLFEKEEMIKIIRQLIENNVA